MITNQRNKPIFDKKKFAKKIINQWNSQKIKTKEHKIALEYIELVSLLGSYSLVYDVPDPPVAAILAKYGLLEQ